MNYAITIGGGRNVIGTTSYPYNTTAVYSCALGFTFSSVNLSLMTLKCQGWLEWTFLPANLSCSQMNSKYQPDEIKILNYGCMHGCSSIHLLSPFCENIEPQDFTFNSAIISWMTVVTPVQQRL
jgi:hypothetical protein